MTQEVNGVSLRAVGRSAFILTGAAGVVQVIGIVRELFVAAQIGISSSLDAFLIAMVLPTTLAGVLTTGTVTALVPAYVRARDLEHGLTGRRLTGAISVWVGLAGLAIAVALELFAPFAIAIAGPGLATGPRDEAIGFLRLLAPVTFVAAISGVLYGVLQAEERFAAIAAATLAGAATTLGAILVLWSPLGLGALAVGNLLGPTVVGGILLTATVRASISPEPTLWISRREFTAFMSHAGPLTLSGAILQINVIADRAIASLLAPGAVSALRYADVLVRTPIAAIGPAWGAALYPALVRLARDTSSSLSDATDRSIRYAISIFIPIAILTVAVAKVAVAAAYARGAFTIGDVDRTGRAVAAFAPLIVILMVSPSLTGALNARRRGTVLLIGGILSVLLNVALDLVLGLTLGAEGVALASSITSIIVLAFFAWRLGHIENAFQMARIVSTVRRASLASLPAAIVIAAVAWSGFVPSGTLPSVVALIAFGLLGTLGYIIVAHRTGPEETRTMLRIVVGWVAGRRREARTTR